jgi:TatD DNase family protein
MLVDTHAHLDFPDFQQDFDAVLQRAASAGVTRIVTIGTSLKSSALSIALAERYDQIYAVVGIHPTSPPETHPDAIRELRKLAAHPKVVAIGETGLDFHHLPGNRLRDVKGSGGSVEASNDDEAHRNSQTILFRRHLDLAAELRLNVVIHQREAWHDTLEIIRGYKGQLRGVFHCFSGSPEHAAAVSELGHLISFTGIVTFKNAGVVRESAIAAQNNGFMVETDCPYLAPVPYRGKRCEPAFAMATAKFIADLRGVSVELIAQQTTRAAEDFFLFSR